MGHAVRPQDHQLLPHERQDLVGHLLRLETVERTAGDGVVGQHEPVGFGGRGEGRDPRRADPHLAGHERDERFVLDGAPQRRVGLLVAEVPGLDPPVDAEHEIGAALVGTERLHEQLRAIGRGGEVGGRAAGVEAGLLELGQRLADRGQPRSDARAGRPLGRTPEEHDHRRTGGPSGEDRHQGVERDRRLDEVDEGDGHRQRPPDPPPRARDPGGRRGDHGDQRRNRARRPRPAAADGRDGLGVRDRHGRIARHLPQPGGDQRGGHRRHDRGDQDMPRPRPHDCGQAGSEEHHAHDLGGDRQRGEEPHREAVEALEELGDDADRPLAEQGAEERHHEQRDHGDGHAQDVARRLRDALLAAGDDLDAVHLDRGHQISISAGSRPSAMAATSAAWSRSFWSA